MNRIFPAFAMAFLLARPLAAAEPPADPAQPDSKAALKRDLEKMFRDLTSDHEITDCLQFDAAADEREFRSKAAEISKKFEQQAALPSATSENNGALLESVNEREMLLAEFSNPGCASGGAWRLAPPWPKGELGSVRLKAYGSSIDEDRYSRWTFVGAAGSGRSKSGTVQTLTLELTKPGSDVFVIHRKDESGSMAGLTATYIGAPRHQFLVGVYNSTWPGHWKDQRGYWYARFDFGEEPKSTDLANADADVAQAVPEQAVGTDVGAIREPARGSRLPPPVLHICLAGCGTLYLTGDRLAYSPTPGVAGLTPGGYGIFIRTFTARDVVLDRYDAPNQYFPRGLKAVISGRVAASGNSLANGRIDWTFGQSGAHGALMTWGDALNDIPGQGPPPYNLVNPPDEAPPPSVARDDRAPGADGAAADLVMQHFRSSNAMNTGNWRLLCSIGSAQESVDVIRRNGLNVTVADECVAALRFTAHDGKLLQGYVEIKDAADEPSARSFIRKITDEAPRETGPFRASGTPNEMVARGVRTPALVFDAAFVRAYLEKVPVPQPLPNLAELRRNSEACLNLNAPLATCAAVGRVQGALAYRARDSVGDYGGASPGSSEGPDRQQAEGAIDSGFARWSSGWAMDRYQRRSAHITDLRCDASGCQVQGRFSFFRAGNLLTIPFLADFARRGADQYQLDRLCYSDPSVGQQDCTD